MTSRLRLAALCAVLLLCSSLAFGGTTIVIVNLDGVNEGFNDPTPAAPIGGNPGTTVGQQRLNAFQHAANIWGAQLDSAATVRIRAAFNPLTCTATSATLGSAGTIQVFRFTSSGGDPEVVINRWYHVALTNKLVGADVSPASDDINAQFNSNLNGNPACLGGTGWYYGFDGNHGANIDLVAVLLHEFAHGLGFSQFASITTGANLSGFPDIYNHHLFDNTQNKTWPEMTNAERAASAQNARRVVWDGARVTNAVPSVLSPGTPILRVNSPAAIAGVYAVGAASFGPALSTVGVGGDVVVALDPANAAGPSTTDGCSPLTNAGAVSGRVALVDRGTCGFVVKVANAQAAGAVAVIIADNVAGSPPAGLGGADPSIVIPSVRITLADGNAIKAAMASNTVNVTLSVDLSVLAGADAAGRAMVFTPSPVQPGSSVSHWDTSTFRNQLMEPAINGDLTHSVNPPEDLTRPQLRDIGWYPDGDLDFVGDDGADECLGSDLRGTIVIGAIDTGVPNVFFSNGCTITDLVNRCKVDARNHGAYASCGAHTLDAMVSAGFLTDEQKDIVQSAVAKNK
jgi:hypothetical protein